MFENFKLEIKLEKNGIMPTRAHSTDAGLDFYSPEDFEVKPRGSILIPLQLRVKFTDGFAMVFAEKSGVATKKNLDNGAKIVDSAYRGIVHAHFFNNSDKFVKISRGEKIVQALFIPIWSGQPIEISDYDLNSERGEGGFGSTGV